MYTNAYVINMPGSTDRWKKMQENAPKLETVITRIPAIVGKELTQEELKDQVAPACQLACTSSMIGCYLSHISAWKKMIANNDPYAIVMEDDCELADTFKNESRIVLEELVSQAPDFDFLYLGCFGACNAKPANNDPIVHVQQLFLPRLKPDENDLEHSFVPETPLGFHCYLLSNKCARTLVKYMTKANFHIDVDFVWVAQKHQLKVYASKQNLAHQFSNAKNSTQTTNFPIVFNVILEDTKCNKGIGYDYYFSAPLCSVFNFNVNLYVLVLIAMLWSVPGPFLPDLVYVLLALLLVELYLDPSNYDYVLFWGLIICGIFYARIGTT